MHITMPRKCATAWRTVINQIATGALLYEAWQARTTQCQKWTTVGSAECMHIKLPKVHHYC